MKQNQESVPLRRGKSDIENSCKVEVLAPVGGRESLEAAVRCGADAVYLGGQSLNARRNAENFDDEGLVQAVRYCHVRGVKVYLTLNTLVFDRELPSLLQALEAACAAGVDALIVQDLAVAGLARDRAPGLVLHASTQMGIHDAHGARMLRDLGFSRVVLARELSRDEIASIHQAADIELECFVHGALCMSVSGQCYLSSVIGGRSGNRGLCAQPCRLPFRSEGSAHALSLRDLSLIPHAGELAALGVRSLKIEGRMKRPEYVAAAVTACRAALAGETPDYAALEAVFSRSGFTAGYYEGTRGGDMFGTRRREDVQSAAPVLKELAALYREEAQSVPVCFSLQAHRGQPAVLRAADGDGEAAHVQGPVPQEARSAPTDAGRAAAALSKTGGTPYTICNIECDIDDGLMLPASQLNAMRRDALEQLTQLRGAPKPHPFDGGPLPTAVPYAPPDAPWLRVRLARAEQLTQGLAAAAEQITLPADELRRLSPAVLNEHSQKLLVELPAVLFDSRLKLHKLLQDVKQRGIDGAVVGGLGQVAAAREAGLALHGNYGLNITNTLALEAYGRMGLADVTLSLELELGRVRALGGALPRGMLAYGHLPLMTTRNCPAGSCESCGRSFPALVDRKGNHFFVDCTCQVPTLYNHIPLFLADRLAELRGVDFLTLYFTRESPAECARIAALYRTGGTPDGPLTRGLYYRKVL